MKGRTTGVNRSIAFLACLMAAAWPAVSARGQSLQPQTAPASAQETMQEAPQELAEQETPQDEPDAGTVTDSGTVPGAVPASLDAKVRQAIGRGLNYLYTQQSAGGAWETRYSQQHSCGASAVVVLAALTAGQNPKAPPLAAAVAHLERSDPQTVYARAFRAMVYARLGDSPEHQKRLKADVAWLIQQQRGNGGWGYGPDHPTTRLRSDWTDNSNSQAAALALAEAERAGASVPPSVWRRCRTFWLKGQNVDGGWGYDGPNAGTKLRPESYGSMTAAGAASLYLVDERLATFGGLLRDDNARSSSMPDSKALAKAVRWLDDNYSLDPVPRWPQGMSEEYLYYYLHCLQRTLDASGRPSGPGGPWARQMAQLLLERQQPDGCWLENSAMQAGDSDPADAVVPTSFALLVLANCRQSVLINKLALDQNDSCDAANLARYLAADLSLAGSWQHVTPSELGQTIGDAPILFITGRGKARLPASADGPIREFLAAGGTVLIQPAGGDADFARSMRDRFARLFPSFVAGRLDASHPVFHLKHEIDPNAQVEAWGLGDGGRTRVFILDGDLSTPWHMDRVSQSPEAFQFAANLLLYTTDLQPPRPRFANRQEPSPPEPVRSVAAARVRHDGDWDACPQALPRLGRTLQEALSLGLAVQEPVDLRQPVPADVRLLWLSGSRGLKLDAAQRDNLRRWIDAGGTLFADSAWGGEPFVRDAVELARELFGRDSVASIPASHPLLSGSFAGGIGADVRQVEFTRALAKSQGAGGAPQLWGVTRKGRLAVIISGYGVTCPIEGVATYGCRGLATADARRLGANVVLWAGQQSSIINHQSSITE